MWTKPWNYKEGTAIAVGLTIVGLMLQYSVGPLEWKIFMWPANIIVLAVFVLFVVMAYALRRSEEHTSELQSRQYLVCRLLLEKKKMTITPFQRMPDTTS